METCIIDGSASIQGSEAWKKFRQTRITASDMPVIMGVSKWSTPYKLWQEKLGFKDGYKDNWAMKRGRDLEPVVLQMVNDQLGMAFEPCVIVHSEIDWAAASLDGFYDDYVLEIKCPGLADHKKAEDGEVPEKYYHQVQWQLFCADVKIAYYASYYNEELVIIKVNRDDDYIAEHMLPAASKFYICMIDLEAPEQNEDDYVEIVDPLFEEYAREWKAAKEMLDLYKNKVEELQKKLVDFTDDSNSVGYGLKLKRVQREGNIDWKRRWADLLAIREDADEAFPESDYRKEGIGYWKISENT